MGTQLNIKDAETVELARDLAKQLNKSVTETIKEALVEKARVRETEIESRIADMNALVDQIRAEMPAEVLKMRSRDVMDAIYDDDAPDGFAR